MATYLATSTRACWAGVALVLAVGASAPHAALAQSAVTPSVVAPPAGHASGTPLAALLLTARDAVDHGEFERDATVRAADYARAVDAARRAVALDASSADAHFHLARALGRTALAMGVRDRVKYAVEVRDEALRSLALAPSHPGALHVLGVWNAEVMRLSGFERAVARTFLGGKVFGAASWADATRSLEQAVRVEPDRLIHHLDLARIYRDQRRPADALRSYEAALRAPLHDANDARYREQAQAERNALPGR